MLIACEDYRKGCKMYPSHMIPPISPNLCDVEYFYRLNPTTAQSWNQTLHHQTAWMVGLLSRAAAQRSSRKNDLNLIFEKVKGR